MLTDRTSLREAFRAVSDAPGAAVAAIGADGFRTPLPPELGVPAGRAIPLPQDRATMLDLVLPAQGLVVIRAWEEAREHGRSSVTVHLREDPATPLALHFFDLEELGVVAVLTPVGPEGVQGAGEPLAVSAPALRPRTGTVRKAYNAVITDVDDRALRMLGCPREQVVGVRSSDLLHPEDTDRAVAAWMQMLSTQQGGRIRVRHLRGDGSWLWVELENVLTSGSEGAPEVVTQMSDISEEMGAHEEVARQGRFFRRLAEAVPLGLVRLGASGAVDFANARALQILGPGACETLQDLLLAVEGPDGTRLRELAAAVLRGGADQEAEVDLRRRGSGVLLRCRVMMISLGDAEGAPGAMVCLEDVTERARLAAELERRADHDALTGCLNRAATTRALEASLGAAGDGVTGVVFVDLDRFKAVNDTAGHAVGDALLVEVGRRLRDAVRSHDVVGRLGGDEFLVVIRGADGEEAVRAVAGRVAAALTATVVLAGRQVDLSASTGVASSRPGEHAEGLIARADEAMYAAKRARAEADGR